MEKFDEEITPKVAPGKLDVKRLGFTIYLLSICFMQELWLSPRSGVDPSWMIALNLALEHFLLFGQDIVFTYGPLGFLYTKMTINTLWPYLLLYYGIVLTSWGFIFYTILSPLNDWKEIALLSLIVFMAPDKLAEHSLFFQFFFFVFYAVKYQKIWAMIPAIVIAVLMLFAKLSFGLIVNFLLYASFLYIATSRLFPFIKLLVLTVLHGGLIALSTLLLPVEFSGYLVGGFHFISAFNDAMYFSDKISLLFLLGAILMALTYASLFFKYFVHFFQKKNLLFFYACVALMLFLLFKHGFLRADIHLVLFFGFAPLYYYLFYWFTQDKRRQVLSKRILLFFLVCAFISVNTFPLIHYLSQNSQIKYYFKSKYPGIKRSNFTSYSLEPSKDFYFVWNTYWESASLEEADTLIRQLNSEWLELIGESSIDILPYEISLLYFNQLNYRPRPVIQSYSAYDLYLDSLNKKFLQSDKAPQYLLFAANSIDDRYALFDEGRTKEAILRWYNYVGRKAGLILLERRSKPRSLKRRLINKEVRALGDTIAVSDQDGLSVVATKMEYSTLGRLQRFFYQPPPLYIELFLEDGSQHQFRAIPTVLESGVIVDKFIYTLNDYEDFFKNLGKNSNAVTAYRFFSSQAAGFRPSFEISYYRLSEKE